MISEKNPPVVTIAFRKVKYTGERNYSFHKIGNPVLEVEVLGDRTTLEEVGELLFEHYMREELGEELYEHVWRFEACGAHESSVAYNSSLPILSLNMSLVDQYAAYMHGRNVDEDEEQEKKCRITEGTEMIFFYDEGSTSRLAVTIETISPMPTSRTIQSYPSIKIDQEKEEEGNKKRRLLSSIPILTVRMDDAFPALHKRLLKERGVKFDIGNGSGFRDTGWAMIWGGGNLPAFTSSLECIHPFDDLDEAFQCFGIRINTINIDIYSIG